MPKPTTIRLDEELKEEIIKITNSLSLNEAIKKALKEYCENKRNGAKINGEIIIPKEKTSDFLENRIPPCEYASLVVKATKHGIEYYSYCDNPKKTNLPRNRLIPCQACQKCYQRQKERKNKFKQIKLHLFDYLVGFVYECVPHEQQPKFIRSFEHGLSVLPCIKNPEFDCLSEFRGNDVVEDCPLQNKEWRKIVKEYLEEEGLL